MDQKFIVLAPNMFDIFRIQPVNSQDHLSFSITENLHRGFQNAFSLRFLFKCFPQTGFAGIQVALSAYIFDFWAQAFVFSCPQTAFYCPETGFSRAFFVFSLPHLSLALSENFQGLLRQHIQFHEF